MKVGDRVVVRYRLNDGRATDVLGTLLSGDETHLVIDGKRGIESVEVSRIIAAKEVPPAPTTHPARPVG